MGRVSILLSSGRTTASLISRHTKVGSARATFMLLHYNTACLRITRQEEVFVPSTEENVSCSALPRNHRAELRWKRKISKTQVDKPFCKLSHVAMVEFLHCMAGVVVEIYIREVDFSDPNYHVL